MDCNFCGDYHSSGVCWREKEYKRQQAVNIAVERADRIICDAAAGDTDELLLLTITIAKAFAEKVEMMATSAINKKMFWGEAR